MFFWIWMLLSALNVGMMFQYGGETGSLGHFFMFLYCMTRGWEESKRDGITL